VIKFSSSLTTLLTASRVSYTNTKGALVIFQADNLVLVNCTHTHIPITNKGACVIRKFHYVKYMKFNIRLTSGDLYFVDDRLHVIKAIYCNNTAVIFKVL